MGEGNGKQRQHSCLENPLNNMRRQKDMTLKDELLRLVGAQYATVEKQRNSSRRNEEVEPKQKQHTAVDVSVVKVKFDAVNNTAQEAGMLGS